MIKFASLRGTQGHLILNTLRFFLEKKIKYQYLIIATPKNKIVNLYLYNVLKYNFSNKKIIFTHNKIIYLLYLILFKLGNRLSFFSKFTCNIEWLHHENPKTAFGSKYNFDEKFYSNVPEFYIQVDYIQKFDECFNKKKLLNKKFICLSSRDNYYHKEKNENFRNSNFSDYKKIFIKFIKLGYCVIRMGHHKKNDFLFKDKNYYDFYVREKNNKYYKLLEVLIFKNCEFIISSPSGIDAYAALFNKRIFLINHFPAGRIPRYKNCMFIPQSYIKKNKLINFNKINKNILLCEETEVLKKLKISTKKNTPEDIYNMVIKNYKSKKLIGKNLKNKYFIIEGKNSSSVLCNSWYKNNKHSIINKNKY